MKRMPDPIFHRRKDTFFTKPRQAFLHILIKRQNIFKLGNRSQVSIKQGGYPYLLFQTLQEFVFYSLSKECSLMLKEKARSPLARTSFPAALRSFLQEDFHTKHGLPQ